MKKRIKIYDNGIEYYMVGIHREKESIFNDVKKYYKNLGYKGVIAKEDIKKGILYGDFDNDKIDSYFNGETTQNGKLVINSTLIKEYGSCIDCFFVNMEDVEEDWAYNK